MLIQEHVCRMEMVYSCNKSFNVVPVIREEGHVFNHLQNWIELELDCCYLETFGGTRNSTELRADALVLLMWIPGEYFCVLVCPLAYLFRLSPMISPPTRTLTLFFPSNTSCLWLMVKMGLWVDVTSVFSLTAVQEEGGGFSHLRERKTEDEKEEERTTALSVHKCRRSDVTRHRCVAQLWPERGRPETSYHRSLGNSFFTLVILWNFFFGISFGISFLSVCVCVSSVSGYGDTRWSVP